MTNEEAEECAKSMTYKDALYNLKQAKCVPYKKATLIKINELLAMIESLPGIQPKAKVGHWIGDKNKTRWECSYCGLKVIPHCNTPYCPNCGTKMEEE